MLAVDTAIFSLLSADATLASLATNGIHRLAPKEGVLPPYLVFQALDDEPTPVLGVAVARVVCLYQVTGVGVPTASKGAGDVAEGIRDRAVALLTGRTGGGWTLSVTGYSVRRVFWTRNLSVLSQTIGGVQRCHAPAYLSIWVCPT